MNYLTAALILLLGPAGAPAWGSPGPGAGVETFTVLYSADVRGEVEPCG